MFRHIAKSTVDNFNHDGSRQSVGCVAVEGIAPMNDAAKPLITTLLPLLPPPDIVLTNLNLRI